MATAANRTRARSRSGSSAPKRTNRGATTAGRRRSQARGGKAASAQGAATRTTRRKGAPGAASKAGQAVGQVASKAADAAPRAASTARRKVGRALVRRALRATVRAAERRLEPAGQAASELVERARGYGEALLADRPRGWPLERRPPIQRSIDVAVPLELAWDEWMRFEFLPEGAHRVQGIERDGDGRLFGRLSGLKPGEWEAEVLDERQDESFAWRSVQGSDCAGLLTFHRLGPRLTRLELQLDVVPSGFTDAAALLLHLADRRAEADLRRFKSRLETINPDEYPSLDDEEAAEETEERWQ